LSTRASKQTNNESRIIKFQKKNSRDLIESLRVGGEEAGRGIGGSGSESEAGGGSNINPNPAKITELGDITSPLNISFNDYSDRTLVGNVNGNTTITFSNLPFLLFLNLRLIIKSVDPIITIAGQIVSGVGSSPLITTAVNDFLDITVGSDDQVTIFIGTTKKNDESGADVAPTLPQSLSALLVSDTEVELFWSDPTTGNLPITYEVAWSTSNAGNAADGPDTPAAGSPDIGITDNSYIIPGLVIDTTYYFWVRAVNSEGNSDYAGPHEQATLGPPVFTLASAARTMDATVTWVPFMSIVIIEVANDSGFTDIINTRIHSRSFSGDWSTSENELFKSATLFPSTLYYVRARFIKNQVTGPNSAGQSSTTGTLLPPSQPTLTLSSPSTGIVTIKIRYDDDPTRDEEATVSWRLQSSSGPYTAFGGNQYQRNSPPIDDLDSREDRLEVDRTGGWPNGVLLTFRCALTNIAGDAPVETENVTIDT